MRGQTGGGWLGGNGGNGGGSSRKSDPSVKGPEVACAARDVEMMSQNPRGTTLPPAAAPQSAFAGADGASLGSSGDAAQVRSGCGEGWD